MFTLKIHWFLYFSLCVLYLENPTLFVPDLSLLFVLNLNQSFDSLITGQVIVLQQSSKRLDGIKGIACFMDKQSMCRSVWNLWSVELCALLMIELN